MEKKLNLRALKDASESALENWTEAISLWATVSRKNIEQANIKDWEKDTEATQTIDCVCPTSDQITDAAHAEDINIPSIDWVLVWEEPKDKNKPVIEEDWFKAMISLWSIKSAQTQKMSNTQDQETNTQKVTLAKEKNQQEHSPLEDLTSDLNTQVPIKQENQKLPAISPKIDSKKLQDPHWKENIQSLSWKNETTKNTQEHKTHIEKGDKKETKQKSTLEIEDDIFDNYVPKYEKASLKNNKEKRKKGFMHSKKRNFILASMLLCVLGFSFGWYIFFHNINTEDSLPATAIETSISETKQNVEEIISTSNSNEEENDWQDSWTESKNDTWEIDKNSKVKNYLLDNYYN